MKVTTAADKDLTRGSVYKHMIRIGIPAALGMVFNTLYNLTDNWFAGQISDIALSGLSIASIVFALFLALGMGLQSGTSAMVAADLGSKNKKQVIEWLNCSHGITWFLSLLILILGLLFAQDLLSFLSDDAQIVTVAWEYTSVILWGNVFFNLTSCFAGALIAHGNTTSYRNVLVVGFFANWLLNPLFIFVFDLGAAGLAWSTLIIKMGSSLYLWKVLMIEAGVWSKPAYNFEHWRQLMAQIMPASMNMLTIIIGGFITIYFISQFGDFPVAGYSVGIRIEQLLLMPALGLNASVMALVGQNYGAGNIERVREIYAKSLKVALLISIVFIPTMIFLSPLMMTQFTDNQEIIGVGVYYLRADAFAFFGYMMLFCSNALLQAVKQPLFPLVIGILRQMVLPIIAFYLLINVLGYGLYAIFWAIVTIVLLSAAVAWFYTRGRLALLTPAIKREKISKVE
ncbi:MATE family efflux transporter [Marinicella sp. S1101]|uniref:MATE family efflux transporter n=1 Tax=Marinicella marina TaxID=2996016 RepID=UPI002260A3B7|nr:MATE family efflux transporter [Marinicella marina]MCX7553596.1 MATE family efflux transporter [Marinicella marina]MDJ1140220.1 MATE family efflux transporter [Marinicella marina]